MTLAYASRPLHHEFEVDHPLTPGRWGPRHFARDLIHGGDVVLHTVTRQGVSGADVERFRTALALAQGLHHPHLSPVVRWGTTRDLLWWTEPPHPGTTLAARLTGGHLDLATTGRIAHQIASALDYAHRCGTHHGLLTTEDVFIDDSWWVTVRGVGLAPGLEPPAPPFTPEHLESIAPLGAGADQRALAELVARCLADESWATNGIPDLPPVVISALTRATAARPVDRFGDPLEFVAALDGPAPQARQLRPAITSEVPDAGAELPRDLFLEEMEEPAGPQHRFALGGAALVGSLVTVLLFAFPRPHLERTYPIVPPTVANVVPEAPAPTVPPPAPSVVRAPAVPVRKASPPVRTSEAPRSAATRVTTPPPPPLSVAPALPTSGYVSIGSSPWGDVTIDGEGLGATPLISVPLAAGTHRLRLTHDGYEPLELTFEVQGGETTNLRGLRLKELTP